MPMSQSASSSPTPRSTSSVMRTGLLALTSDERTVGLVHRTTTGARLVLWDPAERLGISHGRSSKDVTTFIACRPRSVVLPAHSRSPRPSDTAYGAVTPFGSPANATNASRDTAMRDCSARAAPYREPTWGTMAIQQYRTCMAQHGHPE